MSVIPTLNGFFIRALRGYTSTKRASAFEKSVATAGQGLARGPFGLSVGMLQYLLQLQRGQQYSIMSCISEM